MKENVITLPDGNTAIKINGYKHYYVTRHGEVWSSHSNKYLAQAVFGQYSTVRLYSKGHQTTHNVHSLVATAFVHNPNPLVNIMVNHIDEDKLNNNASNLEWVTHAENLAHSTKPVYQYSKEGEFIRKYPSQTAAAKALGVTQPTISEAMDKPNRFCRGYKMVSVPM